MARDLTTRVFTPAVSPEQAEQKRDFEAFVAYMNHKAAQIGMTHSAFNDAAGMHNFSTARDLLRLAVYADQHPVFRQVWSQDKYTVTVEGVNPRKQDCFVKSKHPDLNDHYNVLGRKGGGLIWSRSNLYVYNLASILEIPGSTDRLVVVTMYAPGGNQESNNRFQATKEVADIAMALYKDPAADVSNMPVCCENAIIAVLPPDGKCYDDLKILYEKDADTLGRPMSISKVLTTVCVLDHVQDLSRKITYDAFDANIGPFYVSDFAPGDVLTYIDALHAMMLESSNVTAQALARSTGKIIAAKA